MENASKALIMAAEILIGVMIISIGVYLFNTMGSYSAETAAQMEEAQIAEFNQQFLHFYGTSGGEIIQCTIHEIVGLANLAQKVNSDNGFLEIEPISDTSYYIRIDVQIGTRNITNLEHRSQDYLIQLIKENDLTTNEAGEPVTKYFYCKEEPGIGAITKE